MTIDEAIKRFSDNAEYERSHGSLQGCLEFRQLAEWLAELKELREQTEDCISRQAVLDYVLKDNYYNGGWFEIEEDKYVEWLKALPSVTPKPKTGHWIKEETIYGWDRKSYQCSCCGRSIHLDTVMEDLDDYPYCHCGAKMEGGE